MSIVQKRKVYKRQGVIRQTLFSIALVLVWTFLGSFIVEGIFISSVKVNSSSMQNTLSAGDLVFVSPLIFGKKSLFSNGTWLDLAAPGRNAIVLLDPPYIADRGLFANIYQSGVSIVTLGLRNTYRSNTEKPWMQSSIIRRVIALPGEAVKIVKGKIYIRAFQSTEYQELSKLSPMILSNNSKLEDNDLRTESPEIILDADEYYVLAENTNGSEDSRSFGPVRSSSFRGQVILRYWPISKIGPVD